MNVLVAVAALAAFFTVRQGPSGRWTLVDPEGRDFYQKGIDHCKYEGFEDATDHRQHYREAMDAKFGGDRAAWAAETAQRLRDWGFNTIGINTKETPELRGRGLRRVEFLWTDGFEYLKAPDHQIPPRCPNMFHPDWPRHCQELAAKVCLPQKDDPDLIGYFIGNELHWWANGKGEWHTGLFTAVAEMPDTSSAKRALLAYTGGRTNVDTKVREGFTRLCAERYFSGAVGAIRKYDRNHLVLGCRFMGLDGAANRDVLEVAAKYCDVLSVNVYPGVDLDRKVIWPNALVPNGLQFNEAFAEKFGGLNKPFLITEWSIRGASARNNGIGTEYVEPTRRAKAAMAFVHAMRKCPFIVGWNWFMWTDAPVGGIGEPNGDAGAWGLVNEAGVHAAELADAFRASSSGR